DEVHRSPPVDTFALTTVHQYGSSSPFQRIETKFGLRRGGTHRNSRKIKFVRKPRQQARKSVVETRRFETHYGSDASLSSSSRWVRNSLTSDGASKCPALSMARRPTENARPSISGMIANTVSSVTSSPMKNG